MFVSPVWVVGHTSLSGVSMRVCMSNVELEHACFSCRQLKPPCPLPQQKKAICGRRLVLINVTRLGR